MPPPWRLFKATLSLVGVQCFHKVLKGRRIAVLRNSLNNRSSRNAQLNDCRLIPFAIARSVIGYHCLLSSAVGMRHFPLRPPDCRTDASGPLRLWPRVTMGMTRCVCVRGLHRAFEKLRMAALAVVVESADLSRRNGGLHRRRDELLALFGMRAVRRSVLGHFLRSESCQ